MICALVQILMEKTKMMPGRIMVLLVVSGAILGFVGLYQPFADWAGAGATVPLLGFGNTLFKGVKEAVGKDGSWAFSRRFYRRSRRNLRCAGLGYLVSLVSKPKMK